MFADGGLYRGEMLNGRIVGHGDYQSAFNEVSSGYFSSGVLDSGASGRGFFQNAAGEAYMGPFVRGELHGQGTFLNARGDSYEGAWRYHLRHGRGVTKLHNVGAYRGYYVNNLKHGKGGLEYGRGLNARMRQAKEKQRAADAAAAAAAEEGTAEAIVVPQQQQKQQQQGGGAAVSQASHKNRRDSYEEELLARDLSEFDFLYQGFIAAGSICNRGSAMNTHLQVPAIISRLDRRARSHTQRIANQLLKPEERQQKSSDRAVERSTDVELHVRGEMTRKKLRIFNQQKHFAKKVMYSESADRHLLQSKLFIRKERLKTMNEESWPYKQAALQRMQHADNSSATHLQQAFDRIRPEELQRLIKVNKLLSERNRKARGLVLQAESEGIAAGDESVRSGVSLGDGSIRTASSARSAGGGGGVSFRATDSLSGSIRSSNVAATSAALERLMLEQVNEPLLQVILSDFEEVTALLLAIPLPLLLYLLLHLLLYLLLHLLLYLLLHLLLHLYLLL